MRVTLCVCNIVYTRTQHTVYYMCIIIIYYTLTHSDTYITQVQCCLSGSNADNGSGCPHLQCLTVLKKLCNCPSLIYRECNELDEAKVCNITYFCKHSGMHEIISVILLILRILCLVVYPPYSQLIYITITSLLNIVGS